jgi:hypothetical protein
MSSTRTWKKAYDAAPSNNIKMVIGDLNAKIGRVETYIGTVGNHSLHHDSNDNGQRLIDFAFSNDLIVSSTYFPHKDNTQVHLHFPRWDNTQSDRSPIDTEEECLQYY